MSSLLVTSGGKVWCFCLCFLLLFSLPCSAEKIIILKVLGQWNLIRVLVFGFSPPSPLSVDLKSCMLISKKVERQKQCWQEVILVAGWPKRARRQPHWWGWANWCKLSLEAPDEPQSNLWRTENRWLQILRQTLHRLVQPAAACHDTYGGEAVPVSTV